MMKLERGFFITALTHIAVRESLGRGFRFHEDWYLTDDPGTISSLLTPDLQSAIGGIETHHIRHATAVLYWVAPETLRFSSPADALSFLGTRLRIAATFLSALWFAKDNSVNFELGFLHHPSTNPLAIDTHSNAIAVWRTMADGSQIITAFGLEELRFARDVFDHLLGHLIHTDPPEPIIPIGSIRPQRSLIYAQAARIAPTLGDKVAGYVTALEALFATESQELAHRLSERVAFFLADSADDRLTLYKRMRRAYSIRSRTVHGDRLAKDHGKQISEVSLQLDSYVRAALLKIFQSEFFYTLFSGSSDPIDAYFLALLFGCKATAEPAG